MCPIAWDDGKPSSPPVTPIHNVRNRSFARFLGEVVGVFVHWKFSRTLPCLGGQCHHCREGLPSRWAGYAPVLIWKGKDEADRPVWSPHVLFVPAANKAELDAVTPLAGGIFTIERTSKGTTSLLTFTLAERPKVAPLEATFDVRAVLQKLWRYAEPEASRWKDEAPPVAEETGDDTIPATLKFRRKGGAA